MKVYKTVCELSGIQSPWWYQLEVIERSLDSGSGTSSPSEIGEESEAGAGQFQSPKQVYEVQLCKEDSVSPIVGLKSDGWLLIIGLWIYT